MLTGQWTQGCPSLNLAVVKKFKFTHLFLLMICLVSYRSIPCAQQAEHLPLPPSVLFHHKLLHISACIRRGKEDAQGWGVPA